MFDDYFEVFIADTLDSRDKHYLVRSKVFNQALSRRKAQVESEATCTDLGLADKWDDDAVHFIVKEKSSGEYVGALRLVFQNQGCLPIIENETLFEPLSEQELGRSVELSRLCLLDKVRRQQTDDSPVLADDKVVSLSAKRSFHKNIIWGLFRAAAIYSDEKGITNWYFTTYKALARLISREGFKMDCIGRASQNSRGVRLPYKMTVSEIFSQIEMTPSTNISLRSYSRAYQFYSEIRPNYAAQQNVGALALVG
jgi:N-acyl amino acid synthase of PEP-CTERM/exosortase system